MEGGMEATWLIFVVVLLGLVFSVSKERKLQREKITRLLGILGVGEARSKGKER